MSAPVLPIREVLAQVLILCDYITDANKLSDIEVLKAKARQVKELLTKNV